MANRRYQPPPRRGGGGGGRGPNRRGSSSPAGIIVATSALVIVAALVGYLAVGFRHSPSSSSATTATPSPTALSLVATPQATAAETPSATAVPTATSAPVKTPTPEPTATATARATRTPAPTSTAAPTAAAAATKPALGSFGELPPADVPTGNSAGRQLSLDYRLNMSLQQVPQSAPVYQLQPRSWTKDDVATLADSLGLTGQVSGQGGSFRVSGGGDLYISGNFVQYIAAADSATPTSGALPSNADAVDTARSWLLKHNLVGANLGDGEVVARDQAGGKVQVRIKPADPDSILSATPSATVTLGPGGTILEADCHWPGATQRSAYGLRGADQLWSDAQNGQGYVEVDPSALPNGSLNGTATITGASVAYTIAGPPDGVQYLVPLVVFNGQATFQGSSAAVPIKVYVPAVSAQSAPRG